MQYFIDSKTNLPWAFEDNVVATISGDGSYTFAYQIGMSDPVYGEPETVPAVLDAQGNVVLPEHTVPSTVVVTPAQPIMQQIDAPNTLQPCTEAQAQEAAKPPPLSGDALIAYNTSERDQLLQQAAQATLGMADAFVAGLLDDADTAKFKAWAQYQLAVRKVDLTQASPVWPSAPTP